MKNKNGFISMTLVYTFLILFLFLMLAILNAYTQKNKFFDGLTESVNKDLSKLVREGKNWNFNYTGTQQLFTVPMDGYYYIETWGAQGGDARYTTAYTGGNGGYSSGYIKLTKGEKLYIYVGSKGQSITGTTEFVTTNNSGFNSGTFATYWASNSNHAGGGGATDVRLTGGAWDSNASLISRIMVAGGGGGASSHAGTPNYSGNGGSGGSLVAGSGVSASTTCYTYGTGGAQSSGGSNITCAIDGREYTNPGLFGKGSGATSYSKSVYSGGGAGYYGGAIGYHAPGGGGSSYISGYAGVNSVTSSGAHTGNTIHYSNRYFINGQMLSGVNSGNGKAKISYVASLPKKNNNKLSSVRYVRDCVDGNTANGYSHWKEIQVISNGINIAKGKSVTTNFTPSLMLGSTTISNATTIITNGDLIDEEYYISNQTPYLSNQCATIDLGTPKEVDEIVSWHHWPSGLTYANNVIQVSSNNSTWDTIYKGSLAESSLGQRNDNYITRFGYTGAVQNFTAPANGKYKIELWGAQGGSNVNKEVAPGNIGGYGGYSSGIINLEKGTVLSAYVGGQGTNATSTSNANTKGYNGGGKAGYEAACYDTCVKGAGGGGGATDIRLSGSLNDRIMVAGGGGGAANWSSPKQGGNGGGLTGYSGQEYNASTNSYTNPTGGSQIIGGAAGVGSVSASAGQFGIGGDCYAGNTYGGGGGSGYYGGGGGSVNNSVVGSGAGGSSYISGHTGCVAITSLSISTPRSGCTEGTTNNSCSIHYSGKTFSNTVMIDGAGYNWTNTKGSQVVMPSPSGDNYPLGTGNTGNGYAKITYLGNN